MQTKTLGLPLSGAVIATITMICMFTLSRARGHGESANEMHEAPSWTLKDVNGKSVKLSDFKGKILILDFWATWCAPCKMEIPAFIELQRRFGADGVAVVGVSLDDDGPKPVAEFAKSTGITYPIVMSNPKILRDYGNIEAIPTTFIIDRRGKIVSKHVGLVEQETFEKEIKGLLKK
jgi:peroxiredoxin